MDFCPIVRVSAMRAVVLLGLLAGATAFSGPSPVGELIPVNTAHTHTLAAPTLVAKFRWCMERKPSLHLCEDARRGEAGAQSVQPMGRIYSWKGAWGRA
jgi:hypothetical protein